MQRKADPRPDELLVLPQKTDFATSSGWFLKMGWDGKWKANIDANNQKNDIMIELERGLIRLLTLQNLDSIWNF